MENVVSSFHDSIPLLRFHPLSISRAVSLLYKYHMYTDGCISFFSSIYLPAWMAKAIFIDILNLKGLIYNMYLPLTTVDLLLFLCFSHTVPCCDVIYSNH